MLLVQHWGPKQKEAPLLHGRPIPGAQLSQHLRCLHLSPTRTAGIRSLLVDTSGEFWDATGTVSSAQNT
jgi:hypothetical protein